MVSPLVYVADDEPELASMLSEMLVDAGYQVNASPDGATLLRKVSEKRPDLILLDINMPGVTGWDVKRRLDEDARSAGIPVIAVTAQGGASIEASALRALHFADFVRKPFRIADLLDRVQKALDATRQ
ncbi:MAG: response regulator [Candidatus Thermoplasmatota archaeon]